MKNIILAIMFVFSLVWSHDASARQVKHSKKKASVSQKHAAKPKHAAKKSKGSDGYRSSYLRKKHNRSVASTSSSKKAKKSQSSKKSKKKRKH